MRTKQFMIVEGAISKGRICLFLQVNIRENLGEKEEVKMRKRDLAILMLSAFAIFFSLQHEGDFSFKEAWFHLSDEYPIKYEADRLPPPIVADLNGDGKKKFSWLRTMQKSRYFGVLEPHMRRVDEGFSEARVLAEVSLLPDKLRIATGSVPWPWLLELLKRVIIKGAKEAGVSCCDIWLVCDVLRSQPEEAVGCESADFPHNAHHREIAISISNYTLRHGDSGLIIVGGRMEMQPHMHVDPFEEIEMAEKNAEEHRRSATERMADDVHPEEPSDNAGTVDLRHFAFYAFAGRSGELRWTRKNENMDAQSSDASQLIPQHNYKLDVHALNTRHPGEFECREFRESILGVMPHHWDRREDTVLKLAHFRRHKRKTLKKIPGKTTTYPFHKPEEKQSPGKDVTKKVSNVIEKAVNIAKSAKTKKPLPYIPTITNYTQLWWVPNVVVAHEKEGIEAIHLASGRTLCKLHLQEGGLHADINGDGVLDHVQVVGANGAEQTVVSGSMEVLRPCWAIATSGVPVREQLFNASICHHSPFNLFQHGEFSRSYGRHVDVSSLEVAAPILIPRKDGHRHRKRSHGDVVFLTNRGENSFAIGKLKSQLPVGCNIVLSRLARTRCRLELADLDRATWSNLPSPSGMTESTVVPTLKPFPLRQHDSQELILAAGDQEAVVLSPGGSILTAVDLPAPPTHSLVCDDFSNDGLTDFIS
ncbi:hypothetical protein DH2020_015529 [Rehmannia glutinosa]|uniref:Uncharacterized protein n=1 Tax=Rehmannia glutinosa TaxID=99300 RepID=A0ABR0WW77_REHGL